MTCNYTAIQITAKTGIGKCRKAVTSCILERNALSQNFKILKKKPLLNIREKRTDCEVLFKKKILLPTTHISREEQHFITKNPSQGLTVARVYKLGKVFVG